MTDFWNWALATYDKPGVPEACLDLQDQYHQCTAYLLWAAWAAETGMALPSHSLAAGKALAQTWETQVLGPLRSARRALKPALSSMPDEARLTLREQVKAAELSAEKTLMQALAGLLNCQGGAPIDYLSAMVSASDLWSPPAPQAALKALVTRL
jgi:uncharacterized protein (TIGR02444 family)